MKFIDHWAFVHTSIVGLFVFVALACAAMVQAADTPAKIKVLLIAGDDVSAHNWREMSEATRQALVNAGKFDVKVCEDAFILESSSALKRYDLVFLTLYNASTPTLSDAAKENLLDFVRSGKGLAVSHLASASFKEWPEFKKLCGRNWIMGTSGHGPRSVFKVRIVSPDDPIVQGLEDFETDDELYSKLQGDTPINVLAVADSDWSKKTEPLAFTLSYGTGRVFHETFGHDRKAILNPPVQKIIAQGCEWAATGKVE
ncbi:MAG: ThuA domain-containing protein [Candidatus Omnitrophica bacterium]|nr:ThuA domain-containing protein [Candidatus Omnitrophota bacterium]